MTAGERRTTSTTRKRFNETGAEQSLLDARLFPV